MRIPDLEAMVAEAESAAALTPEDIPQQYLTLVKGDLQAHNRTEALPLDMLRRYCDYYERRLKTGYPLYERIMDHYTWPLIPMEARDKSGKRIRGVRVNEVLACLDALEKSSREARKQHVQETATPIIKNGDSFTVTYTRRIN